MRKRRKREPRGRGFSWFPLIFVTSIFVLECITGGVNLLTSSVRFAGFMTGLGWPVYLKIAWVLARMYLLYLIFGLVLLILERGLLLRGRGSRLLLYSGATLYVLLHVLLMHPQIFDEFLLLTYPLRAISEYLTPTGLLVVALGWIAVLAFRSSGWRRAFVVLPLALFIHDFLEFKHMEKPPEPLAAAFQPAAASSGPKNIIILSIDSLNGDFDQVLRREIDPEGKLLLTQLLDKSTLYERAVTPMASTHSSLISFLSGRLPPEHGVRNFLDAGSLDTDRLLKSSPISRLKTQGYSATMIRDTGDYEYFRAGEVLDRSIGPPQGVLSFLTPFILRHRLIFSLFNNPAGFLILPEIRGDSEFTFGYKLPYYTEDVAKYFRTLGGRPSFTLVHTCGMHWPGALQYPFYLKDNSNLDLAQYSYSSQYVRSTDFTASYPPERIQFHRRLYVSGTRYVTYHFLEPLLRQLNDSGRLRDSVVVIMSDHGEDVNLEDSVLPRFRIPQHGFGLLFGTVSDRAFFSVYDPSAPARVEVTRPVSTASLLEVISRTATGNRQAVEARKSSLVYSESSPLGRPQFFGQLVLPRNFYNNLYQVDPTSGDVSARADLFGAVKFQKQRAVYVDDARLTLFPTYYGFRVFLCRTQRDPSCRVNVVNSERPLAMRMLRSLLPLAQGDFDARFFKFKLPAGSSDLSRLEFEFDLEGYLSQVGAGEESAWNALLVGVVRMHGNHHYLTADRIFRAVAENRRLSTEARMMALEQLMALCRMGVYDERWRPEILSNPSPEQVEMIQTLLRYSSLSGWGSCFESVGNHSMKKWAAELPPSPSLPKGDSAVIESFELADSYGLDSERSARYLRDLVSEGMRISAANASRLARQLAEESLSLGYLEVLARALADPGSSAKTPAYLGALEARNNPGNEDRIGVVERQVLLSQLRSRVCASSDQPAVCSEVGKLLARIEKKGRSR